MIVRRICVFQGNVQFCRSSRLLAYKMSRLARSKLKILALLLLKKHLAEENEQENLLTTFVVRKPVSNMFLARKEEGAYNNLINKHLLDEEEKFKGFLRFTREQFSFIFHFLVSLLYSACRIFHMYSLELICSINSSSSSALNGIFLDIFNFLIKAK